MITMPTQELTTVTTPKAVAEVPALSPWRAMWRTWASATRAVLPIFLVTRIVFVLLTYLGGVLFFVPNYWLGSLSLHDVLDTWYRWDSVQYANIAMHGYTTLADAAFFPLYPVLERMLYLPFHQGILLIGMTISNLAFLGTLIVLYRLVETEFDRPTAYRSALYLAIFPSAMFFFAAYNESLFLFFMLLSIYSLRRGAWWLAGLFGALATLTRSAGLFLVLVYLCEFARYHYTHFVTLWRTWRERMHLTMRSFAFLLKLLPILCIPLALGLYAFALSVRFHDPLAFDHAQVHWRTSMTFPWTGPLIAFWTVLAESPFTFVTTHDLIELTSLALFLALLALCFVGPLRFRRDQWIFPLIGLCILGVALIFPGIPRHGGLPYDPLPSTERFVLEVFAGFIMLARLGRRNWFHQGYLLISLPLLAFFTFQFMTGHWTV
jgi:Gpi18-like mannosyltransferase